jgi:7,8-dihydropterin-6-yl-methyl-4-(beta-D-ribofuranosyl)aminobenzene 5'-phosphate synthase
MILVHEMRYIAFFKVPPERLEVFVKDWELRAQAEKVKVILPPHTLYESYQGVTGFVVFEVDDFWGMRAFLQRSVDAGAEVRLVPTEEDAKTWENLEKFHAAKLEAENLWEAVRYDRVGDVGVTKILEILPLVEWRSNDEGLKVETGVSYLVKTDESNILFDLGLNSGQEDPSPLLHNMNRLGVSLDDIDTVVISHNHGDHVGGGVWAKDKTFSVTGRQIDLGGKRVFTPVPMTYPGLKPIHSEGPTKISEGVWTIGTISNSLFRYGLTKEQAIAVNVEGKGIVLIVGCGHQTLPRILERTEDLFEEPIYGIIGGLHYPATGGPIRIFGLYPHRLFGTGKLPWDPVTEEEVQENIGMLESRNPRLVALSSHDSCAASLEAFQNAFPLAFRDLSVGERIVV